MHQPSTPNTVTKNNLKNFFFDNFNLHSYEKADKKKPDPFFNSNIREISADRAPKSMLDSNMIAVLRKGQASLEKESKFDSKSVDTFSCHSKELDFSNNRAPSKNLESGPLQQLYDQLFTK